MPGPLAGLRVIDLTQVLSGPFCTMLLADLGADAVKVEPPSGDIARGWGPAVSGSPGAYGGYFASVNRNKRSSCLDLKQPAGRQALRDLLVDADVLVENFRAGVMDRFGLSYETLHERYPKLVYASICGFGDPRTGLSPHADWPAFDIVAQAMGVLALTERIVYQHSITGQSPAPQGNTYPLLCPYAVVRTGTGFVTVAAPSDHHWRLLSELIGRPELGRDPAYATNEARLAHAPAVYDAIERWSRGRSTEVVVAQLAGRIPCGPVNTAAHIARDPHVAAREMIVDVEHPAGRTVGIVGSPIKLTGTPVGPFVRAPLLGEHTAEVLAELTSPVASPTTEEESRDCADHRHHDL